MQEDAALHMQRNGTCQSQALDITPLGHQILWIVSMANRLHSLGNDRPFVQVVIDIVGSGTNQLDAFFISLMVGPSALEARQLRMVDIDRAAIEPGSHPTRQDLHITGENH